MLVCVFLLTITMETVRNFEVISGKYDVVVLS